MSFSDETTEDQVFKVTKVPDAKELAYRALRILAYSYKEEEYCVEFAFANRRDRDEFLKSLKCKYQEIKDDEDLPY